MKYPLYDNVEIMEHPLIIHKISKMRDVKTGSKEIRERQNIRGHRPGIRDKFHYRRTDR